MTNDAFFHLSVHKGPIKGRGAANASENPYHISVSHDWHTRAGQVAAKAAGPEDVSHIVPGIATPLIAADDLVQTAGFAESVSGGRSRPPVKP